MPTFTTQPDPRDREIQRLRDKLAYAEKQHAAKDRHIEQLAEEKVQLRAALREALDEIDCVEHASLRLKTAAKVIRMIKAALKERS